MLNNKLFSLLGYTTTLFLGYFLILSIFVNTPTIIIQPSFVILAICSIISIAIVVFYYLLHVKKIIVSRPVYLAYLFISTFLIRLIWIWLVETAPISDYFLYHNYASEVSRGLFKTYDITYTLFPFKFGYPFFLAGFYKIFGATVFAGKLFNIFISVCLAWVIYWIGCLTFNETSGRIAGTLYAFWPAQIMYNSVLAAEHIFILLFLLSIALFIKLQANLTDKKAYVLAAFIGIVLTVTQFVRPISLLLFPAFIIHIFLFVKIKGAFIPKLLQKTKIISLIIISYVVSLAVLNMIMLELVDVPIWKSSSGFNILIGTNYESSGMYNVNDEQIIHEFNFDFEKVHKEAASRGFNRIFSQPVSFIRLIEKKMITQWTDECYGYYWSTVQFMKESDISRYLKSHFVRFYALTQFYYIPLLFFALLGCIYILIGIIGEYIGRIYDECKGRPLYIIKDKVGFEDEQSNDEVESQKLA